VLAGAKESVLFYYGSLLENTGPANVEALRAEIPELLDVAAAVRQREMIGFAAYKPPNSHPEKEPRVFDFVGMMGLPLVPCHEFPEDAPAGLFTIHALKDPDLHTKLKAFIAAGKPTLITDGLAKETEGRVALDAENVHVLPVQGDPKSLLSLAQDILDALRRPILQPLGHSFEAPNRVALYLMTDGSWVVENFNDEPVAVKLDGTEMQIGPRDWKYQWK
jgi:hypothetical protein